MIHLRFNVSQRNPNADLSAELGNINHINQVIELVENSLIALLSNNKDNDVLSLEIAFWLIDLIGEIVAQNSVSMPEHPGKNNTQKKFNH
jgi:hypothetical protein